ncbi:protein TolR [Acetobacteraceae bacterium H6797]|nr:protein TolR [Acetobacteraceae bacterium H6797]
MAGGLMNGGRGKGRYRPMAEINVTPMVDVMLVLLIIFMVAAPMMTSGVPVDLPKTNAAPLNQDQQEPLTISIAPDGKIYLQDTEVAKEELVPKLQAIAGAQAQGAQATAPEQRRIFVRGDRTVPYGTIMEVMGTVSSAGFTRVALLAEQPGGRPANQPAGNNNRPPANAGRPAR